MITSVMKMGEVECGFCKAPVDHIVEIRALNGGKVKRAKSIIVACRNYPCRFDGRVQEIAVDRAEELIKKYHEHYMSKQGTGAERGPGTGDAHDEAEGA